jgi:hypothetical protein
LYYDLHTRQKRKPGKAKDATFIRIDLGQAPLPIAFAADCGIESSPSSMARFTLCVIFYRSILDSIRIYLCIKRRRKD